MGRDGARCSTARGWDDVGEPDGVGLGLTLDRVLVYTCLPPRFARRTALWQVGRWIEETDGSHHRVPRASRRNVGWVERVLPNGFPHHSCAKQRIRSARRTVERGPPLRFFPRRWASLDPKQMHTSAIRPIAPAASPFSRLAARPSLRPRTSHVTCYQCKQRQESTGETRLAAGGWRSGCMFGGDRSWKWRNGKGLGAGVCAV